MPISKKYKLPKKKWVKGKSKFVFIRQEEDGRKIKFVTEVKQLSWWKKLYEFIRRIFTKVKK